VWHHEYGWGVFNGGWWFWPHGPFFWLLMIALVVAAVIWLARTRGARTDSTDRVERRSRGLDVLDERYARGEIGRDEYQAKRRDLTG
jgi:putative membrane protein